MAGRTALPVQTCLDIVAHYLQSDSYAATGRFYDVNPQRVKRIIQKYEESHFNLRSGSLQQV